MDHSTTDNFQPDLTRPVLTLKWRGHTVPVPDITFYDVSAPAAVPPLPPRHAPTVIAVAERVELSGTDECLALWKEWMGRNDTDLGVKSQSTLKADSDGYGSCDTSRMRRDNEIAEATDAMIRSLQRSDQWAIRIQLGVASMRVWSFPQLDYIEEAQRARVALEALLKKNVATRLLFG